MSRFILEIVTEELPSRFLKGTEQELKDRLAAELAESGIEYDSIEAHCTPRRSAVDICGLPAAQPLREETAVGPAVRVAFDAEGKPTRAALGFAAGQGASVEDIFRVETPKGEYIAVRKKTGGVPTADILAAACPKVISALPFPKRMRWGSGTFAFARPIHRITALLDDKVVPFTVGDVASGRTTDGHRIHGAGPWEIKDAESYAAVIRDDCSVTLSGEERRAVVLEKGAEAAAPGKVLWKDSLLDEVQGLVEHPVPVVGTFDEAYLELPREVLLTSMEVHQKCFGIEDSEGRLQNKFLTVLNLDPEDIDVVRKGWERVLHARLEDARFYWKTDLKDGFDAWTPMLDKVIFLGPLGSMGDKCRRLEKLAAWIAERTGCDAALAAKAGRIAKSDLVSQMVGEFDTLQGIMGGIYGRKMGLEPSVCDALSEQYLPAGPDSPIPASGLGAVLSMADKADTLVGCFGLSDIPTGAADPFGLRRAALGIIRILLEKGWSLSLEELFAEAWSLYAEDIRWKLGREDALMKLGEFLRGRMKNYFAAGANVLFTEAVLAAGSDDVPSAGRRIAALAAAGGSPRFAATVQTFKRVANIVKKQGGQTSAGWSRELLKEPAEIALADALDAFAGRFEELWAAADYDAILALVEDLRPTVDAFFDGVMVMAEEEDLRRNRLGLLSALVDRMGRLADFSALQM